MASVDPCVVRPPSQTGNVYACTDRDLARRINRVFSEARMSGYEAADGQTG
jgi:hypothetical protein